MFCEWQWALIHVEQLWADNRLTAEGRVLHDRVHEQTEELRGTLLAARGLPVQSLRLGLSGQTDAVEFTRVQDGGGEPGIELPGRSGCWAVQPVEYKRGKAKRESCDRVQLCAQAMCLEEMLRVAVPEGALFYSTPRRRTAVWFDAALRKETESLAHKMHLLFRAGTTPGAVYTKACESCSLKERCLPGAGTSVAGYYRDWLARE